MMLAANQLVDNISALTYGKFGSNLLTKTPQPKKHKIPYTVFQIPLIT